MKPSLLIYRHPLGLPEIFGLDLQRPIIAQAIEHMASMGLELSAAWDVVRNGIQYEHAACGWMDGCPVVGDTVELKFRPAAGLTLLQWAAIAVISLVAVTSLIPKPEIPKIGKFSANSSVSEQGNFSRNGQKIPHVFIKRDFLYPDLISEGSKKYVDNYAVVVETMLASSGYCAVSEVGFDISDVSDISGASYEVFHPSYYGSEIPEEGVTTLTNHEIVKANEEVSNETVKAAENPGTQDVNGESEYIPANGYAEFRMESNEFSRKLKSLVDYGGEATFVSGGGSVNITIPLNYFDDDGIVTVRGPYSGAAFLVGGSPITITFNSVVYSVSGPFTIHDGYKNARMNFAFQRGLPGNVSIEAKHWAIDESGVLVPGTEQTDTLVFNGNYKESRFYTREVVFLGLNYRHKIQFRRVTPEIGSGENDIATLESLYGLNVYTSIEYPGSTIIRVTKRATDSDTGVQTKKFRCTAQRHGLRLDGSIAILRDAFDAANHFWRIYRKDDMDSLDTEKLISLQSEFVSEGRFSGCSVVLDDADVSLGEQLQTIMDTVRCSTYWAGGRQTFVHQYDPGIENQRGQIDYRVIAAWNPIIRTLKLWSPDNADGVQVEYLDRLSKKAYIVRSIADGTVTSETPNNPKKVVLLGVQNEDQAINRANAEARMLLHAVETLQVSVLLPAGSINPGEIWRVITPEAFLKSDRLQAGEITGWSGTGPVTLRIGQPVAWGGNTTGQISLTNQDGGRLAFSGCSKGPDGEIVLPTLPPHAYTAGGIIQLGSRFAFLSGGVDGMDDDSNLYIVGFDRGTEIEENGIQTVKLIKYKPEMFE